MKLVVIFALFALAYAYDDPIYVVKPEMDLGKFSELKHGVSGKVSTSAVQYEQGKEEKKRTLEITDFNYSGEGT